MAWTPDHFRLFISHVSQSHGVASQLATWLHDRFGIHAFVAHADIVPSADWQNEIEESLRTMDALLALVTPGFSTSIWCNQEVGWALGRQCLAISVGLGADPPGFVARFQAVQGGDGNPFGIAERVFGTLANHQATAARIGLTTSRFLGRANSWEQIKDSIAPALRQVTQFTPEALDALQAAFTNRHHVRTSHYLEDIRARLVASGRQVPNA